MAHQKKILISLLILILIISLTLFLSVSCASAKGVPKEITKYAKDWPIANKDYSNSRSSFDSKINSSNVSKLGIAWAFVIPGASEWGAAATNPLILGNTVYLQDLKSSVYAINFKTGALIWSKEYNLDNAGPTGPAIAGGKIFITKGHYEAAALDMKGNELWSVKLSDNENVGMDIQSTAFNGKFYVSTVPGVSNSNFYKGGSVGTLYALDENTGKITWSFDTVDSKDIWGNPTVNSGGGAWYPPAIDPKTSIMYWGIANPGPWPGTPEFPNGTSRPGANLYTNSIVALDTEKGSMLWYNQVLPHDLFDYDLQISPILATISINGSNHDIIIGAGKLGKVFGFDKSTGKTLWETKVGLHQNDELKELPAGTTKVSPGPLGGVETPMAYAEGVVYVPVINMTVEYTPTEFVGKSFDLGAATGELVAIDAATGKILWDKKIDQMVAGAATVVNDLVFTSTYNGQIYAFNRKTGDEIWSYQAPGGINGWPAVSGDTIIFPIGVGAKPVLLALSLGAAPVETVPVTTLPQGGTGKEFAQ